MKKIAFLGCENSHSSTFLSFIRGDAKYSDLEVLGVYSHDREAADRVAANFGVKVLDNYDSAVEQADGIVVTARHGDNHLKYAEPYMHKGIAMFIDKPVTVSEDDALRLVDLAQKYNVKLTGGSSCRLDAWVSELARDSANGVGGNTIGGFVRCPMSITNPNGGFYFYAQHLVEIVGEIFGRYPLSVKAYLNGKKLTVVFRYENFDVTGLFVDESYNCYYAMRITENEVKGASFTVTGSNPCFRKEFDEFCDILRGGEQKISYRDFIAPVFVMNAIKRSLDSGNEEKVKGIRL